jgi:spoIIIJ-associated protein
MTEQHDTVVDETTQDAQGSVEAPQPSAVQATDELDAPEADLQEDEPNDQVDEADGEVDGEVDDASADGGAATGARAPRRTKVADLEREGEVAADFLETLLDIADLDGDIDVDVDGDRAAVSIVDSDEGRVPRRLVGTNGSVLEALQELTRLAVQSATGERSRLMLDVAGHRAERRAALVQIARAAIEEVKATGTKAELEPMSAFERKVVHDEVLAAGLVSESAGVEPRRFVVVLPAS